MNQSDDYTYDLVGHILDYENGDLEYDEVIDLFQHLIDNGMAWTLQGSYGRMAQHLIENNEVLEP